jgi:type I restriction enzyme, R subunit
MQPSSTQPPPNWDELNQSEEPAALLLQKMGWQYVAPETLQDERASSREVILIPRLERAIRCLNPWISNENINRVVSSIVRVPATTPAEANERLHTMLTYGAIVNQDTDDGLGMKGRSVRLFDFDDPIGEGKNEFIFTRQFTVQNVKGLTIIPDIVLFVNGMPLAVIECKSPKIEEPIAAGIDQIIRYQELDDQYEDCGAPKLFETVQVVASICGIAAQYGTTGTPHSFWSEWKVPYPLTLDEFEKKGWREREQDVLLYGLFERQNLLDLIRNFIVFEVDNGRATKKLARYQQFIAVNRAIERVISRQGCERGGVVWHTQGSGKSLTMVYMALKLRRHPGLKNPTLMFVTDRTDLDRQLSRTFDACGFPNPELATRISHLKTLLASHAGKTILTTVQKFGGINEKITDAENIFVMVDEAHRTQYKSLAARMRLALSSACFLGFTGTPIDKKDRSTFQTFGDYIHTYTIAEAVKDRVTVPIFYESRLPEMVIAGETINAIFDRIFKEYTKEQREEIKAFVNEEALAGAPERIKRICLDIIEHFEKSIYPNGFKAQIVAVNRATAVLYKETLDSLNAPKSALIMSIGHNDPKRFRDAAVPPAQQKIVIEDQFKKKDDPLAILIVCDMLLTGFDAPVEQAMYLDSPLREHTLLQAIARVNRKAGDKKTYGLVVDYWGVSRDLQQALEDFSSDDVSCAMLPKRDELPHLESRHQTVMRFFQGIKRNDMEAILKLLEPEDKRAEFNQALKRFNQSLDMILPAPEALRFTNDLRWLFAVKQAARNRFRDASLDLADCGEKVKQLIDQYVSVDGIQQLTEPISIFSREFDETVAKLNSPEARASEMEHALRYEIHIKLQENPVFYRTLKEHLEAIIAERKRNRINDVEQLRLLMQVRDEMRGVSDTASALHMSETQFAFYNLVHNSGLSREVARDLAEAILDAIKPLAVIDWQNKEDIQREMRRQVKRLLRLANIKDNVEEFVVSIIDLARVHLK